MIGASGFLSKRVNRRQVQETIWYRFDLLGFSHSSVRREQHVWWNACSFHWLCCSCPSPQSRLVLGDAKLAFAKNSDVETTVARRLECFFFAFLRRVPSILWRIWWRLILTYPFNVPRSKVGIQYEQLEPNRVRHLGIFEKGAVSEPPPWLPFLCLRSKRLQCRPSLLYIPRCVSNVPFHRWKLMLRRYYWIVDDASPLVPTFLWLLVTCVDLFSAPYANIFGTNLFLSSNWIFAIERRSPWIPFMSIEFRSWLVY